MKNKWIYGLAIFFGLLTTYFLYEFLVSVERKITNDLTTEVVCLAHDVEAQTLLTKEMLTTKNLPEEYIHAQAFRSIEEAVGCISLTPLTAGEQLLKSKVAEQGDVKKGLAYLIPLGERAVSIPVDEVSGVSGLLKPGDRVDVAAVIELPAAGGTAQEGDISSLLVLQDIVILAVGKDMDKNNKLEIKDNNSQTVTLAVTLEEAQSLLLAEQLGEIRLLLRSPADNQTKATAPFTVRNLGR